MTDNKDNIKRLSTQLEQLTSSQENMSKEIEQVRLELQKLLTEQTRETAPTVVPPTPPPPVELLQKEMPPAAPKMPPPTPPPPTEAASMPPPMPPPMGPTPPAAPPTPPPFIPQAKREKSSIERFIGENLINKIGIVILIIGVAIGAKYAIDNDLISPLTRIILGYAVGFTLLLFSYTLKKKYINFSAVLLSGSLAILYFITYAAYTFYDLLPQGIAFALMFVLTLFTIFASLNYDREMIAVFGLVGAYAIPFLLSQNSGEAAKLFSYIAIINLGIIAISFKRAWRWLNSLAFTITWLTYLSWYLFKVESHDEVYINAIFLTIFFLTFYVNLLINKLVQHKKLGTADVIAFFINSFIFYSIGYNLLERQDLGDQFNGLFTLGNAIVHFICCLLVYRKKVSNNNLFYLIAGMVLFFITITIPIQLDGNWVTLMWVGEATILFWIGRTKKVEIFENLSYPLMILGFGSLLHDWATFDQSLYEIAQTVMPFINIQCLTSVLVSACFGFICYLFFKKEEGETTKKRDLFQTILSIFIPTLLIIILYSTFYNEIHVFFKALYFKSKTVILENNGSNIFYNRDYKLSKTVWLINYTLLFLSALSFFNVKKIRNKLLGGITLVLIPIALFIFLTIGLYELSELRESYLKRELSEYFQPDLFNLVIRYISFLAVGITIALWGMALRQDYLKIPGRKVIFDLVLHTTLLWIICSEYIQWMDIVGASSQSYRLGLSLICGSYSLFLIILGIIQKKSYLRISAISLFGLVLVKLFFYDVAHLNTLYKTILFVGLGVLLLIISFLYNKYKHHIIND